jgi:hypothetical protein
MIDEIELRTALHELADRDESPSAPIAGLLRRGQRARVGRVARTAGALGAAGVVLAGLALLPRPATSLEPEAQPVPLALAAQTTAQTTFHITMDTTMDTPHQVATPPWDGKYDPIHDRGFLRMPEAHAEQRQIGPDCYLSDSAGRWYRGYGCWQASESPETAALGDSASPGDLLAQLKHAGNVSYAGRTGSGSHAIDSYRFTFPFSMAKYPATKSGTVDIDVTSRRIIKVSYRMAPTGSGDRPVPVIVVIRLDHFGTPVNVVAPKLAH